MARRALVRARHRHQPDRRAHHVRVRRRARARRDLRAATPPQSALAVVCGAAVLAREPARRRASSRSPRRVGRVATRTTHAGALSLRRRRARARSPIDRAAVPDGGHRTVRTVGARLGSRLLRRSSRSRCGAIPSPVGARRASRSSRIGSFLVPTALGGNVSRLGQYVAGPLLACALLPRRRLLLAGRSRSRCSSGSGSPPSTASRSRTPIPSTHASYYTPARHLPRRRQTRRRSAGSRSRRRTGTGRPRTRRRTCCSRAAGNASSTSRTTRSSTRQPLTAETLRTRGCTRTA